MRKEFVYMLSDLVNGAVIIESAGDMALLETMSDEDLSQLLAITLEDTFGPEELERFVAEMAVADNVNYVEERTIVKLDRKAKKHRNYKVAILQCAKDGNDPNYKKLCTLWKMERFLMRKLEKKWGTKAKGRMRTMEEKAKESKAEPMKKVAHIMTRFERDSHKAKTIGAVPGALKAETNTVMKKLENKIK